MLGGGPGRGRKKGGKEKRPMREYIKVYCCGDCIHYNWKKHRCSCGATQEGKATDHFYRDCPLGIHTEDGGTEPDDEKEGA